MRKRIIKTGADEVSGEEKLRRYEILCAEANMVRERDRSVIQGLFNSFYRKQLQVGIGIRRSYGSILSGDYFDLIPLPDGNYLFIFADLSGHGLPAYTNLIRLRSAILLSVREMNGVYQRTGIMKTDFLIKDICVKFTDILDAFQTEDFACVNFTFFFKEEDSFLLRFYNHSMLFPMVIHRQNNKSVEIYNLNNSFLNWEPQRGYLLGSELRKLLGNDYLEIKSCEYRIHTGDSILFFSDGITEAAPDIVEGGKNEFGEDRLEEMLRTSHMMQPQVIIDRLFEQVYHHIGDASKQKDDMCAILMDFPSQH